MKKIISFAIIFVVWCVFWAAPLLFNGNNIQYLPEPDYGYTIEDYDVDIVVLEDKTMKITEKITANFEELSHGISRYLPLAQTVSYFDENGKQVSISYRNQISNFKYDSSSSSSRTKLVDTDEEYGYMFYYMGQSGYILGKQTYCFSYDFRIGDDRIADMDLFYFNIIGTGWDTSIANVDFSVTFPTEIDSTGFKFYVGQYGEDFESGDERLTYSFGSNSVSGTVTNLIYGEALTVYNEFEDGYFAIEKSYVMDIVLLVFSAIVLLVALIIFLKKRKKDPIVEVVEFSAPEGLTPTEVGYINDGKLTGDEISALVVYWASRGYVKLKQLQNGNVTITKLKDLPQTAKEHEKLFFNSLFYGCNEVTSNNLNLTDMGLGYNIKKSVQESTKHYFDKSVDWLYILIAILTIGVFCFAVYKDYYQACVGGIRLLGEIIAVIALGLGLLILPSCIKQKEKITKKKFTIFFALNLILILGGLITLMFLIEPYSDSFGSRFYTSILLLSCILVCFNLERYTAEGRAILGKIRGLKNYILVAEKDRIEVVAKETPDLFFDILPYAYVLGVSDEFMKKFEDVVIIQPEWYECDSFTTAYFAYHMFSGLNIMATTLRNTMINHKVVKTLSTISSISGGGGRSSGGGGGGFSGGGSGGGGGGRW